MHAENSEVVPLASVAVAVITSPADGPTVTKLNVAFPSPLVVVVIDPRKTAPSPFPLGLQDWLEKNSIVNVAFAVLLSVPAICVLLLVFSKAEVMTGKL